MDPTQIIKQANERIRGLEETTKIQEQRIKELEVDTKRLESNLHRAQETERSLSWERSKIIVQRDDLAVQLDLAVKQWTEKDCHIQGLEQQMSYLQRSISYMQAQSSDGANAQNAIRQLVSQLEKAKLIEHPLQADARWSEEDLDSLMKNIQGMEDKSQADQAQLKNAKEKQAKAELQLVTERTQSQKRVDKIEEAEAMLEEKEALEQELQQRIKSEDDLRKQLEDSADQLEISSSYWRSQDRELQKRLDSVIQEVKKHRQGVYVEQLKDQLQESNQNIGYIKRHRAWLTETLHERDATIEELESTIADFEASEGKYEEHVQLLQQRIKATRHIDLAELRKGSLDRVLTLFDEVSGMLSAIDSEDQSHLDDAIESIQSFLQGAMVEARSILERAGSIATRLCSHAEKMTLIVSKVKSQQEIKAALAGLEISKEVFQRMVDQIFPAGAGAVGSEETR
ncbi:hypothetical protein SCP_1400390 [Sparassis crispa]|uniref:Uncharacterized protein n=1 Tax=Sparassis crispa TaxID=139825 RepID=A0A401H2I7_9APHY|nr:hypothetical protein SCP_1400390 [Sparassis crispa]GBE88634.1 hypothetical protein SCP_1400390 [Sparassis crispa]